MFALSPVASGSPRTAAPEFGAVAGPGGTVLLVEDDEMVAQLVAQMLERRDWRVVVAGEGAEAERLLAREGGSVALAFVDCGLPDVDGGGLCTRLRAARPGLPILLTSGRDRSALARELAVSGPVAFLPKPFLPGAVIRELQSLVGNV